MAILHSDEVTGPSRRELVEVLHHVIRLKHIGAFADLDA